MTCLKGILEKCRELPPVDVDDTGYGKIGILGKKEYSLDLYCTNNSQIVDFQQCKIRCWQISSFKK